MQFCLFYRYQHGPIRGVLYLPPEDEELIPQCVGALPFFRLSRTLTAFRQCQRLGRWKWSDVGKVGTGTLDFV